MASTMYVVAEIAQLSITCGMPIVQCTVYSVQCTVYSVQRTAYSVQRTAYSVQHDKNISGFDHRICALPTVKLLNTDCDWLNSNSQLFC